MAEDTVNDARFVASLFPRDWYGEGMWEGMWNAVGGIGKVGGTSDWFGSLYGRKSRTSNRTMKDKTQHDQSVSEYSRKTNRGSDESRLMDFIESHRKWFARGTAVFGILSLPFFAWSAWLWMQQILVDGLSQSESMEIAVAFGMVAFCCWLLAVTPPGSDDGADDSTLKSLFEE